MNGVAPPPQPAEPCGEKARGTRSSTGSLLSLAAAPGVGASLLPVGICPACWPAYAGLLSALGLGFLFREAWLLPLTILALLAAVAALAWRSGSRRGPAPALLGLGASAAILAGKFLLSSTLLSTAGIVLLIGASIWNAWPRPSNNTGDGTCPSCVPGGQAPPSITPTRNKETPEVTHE